MQTFSARPVASQAPALNGCRLGTVVSDLPEARPSRPRPRGGAAADHAAGPLEIRDRPPTPLAYSSSAGLCSCLTRHLQGGSGFSPLKAGGVAGEVEFTQPGGKSDHPAPGRFGVAAGGPFISFLTTRHRKKLGGMMRATVMRSAVDVGIENVPDAKLVDPADAPSESLAPASAAAISGPKRT